MTEVRDRPAYEVPDEMTDAWFAWYGVNNGTIADGGIPDLFGLVKTLTDALHKSQSHHR